VRPGIWLRDIVVEEIGGLGVVAGRRRREEHAERRAAAGPLLDPSRSVMELGEACDEREPDTDPRRAR
jgi:hypothetical protein